MSAVNNPVKQHLLDAGDSKDLKSPVQSAGGVSPVKTVLYIASNIVSATLIVFANKLVLSPGSLGWSYVYALTFLHTATSWAGMGLFAAVGMYTRKPLPKTTLLPLACAYVGYVVLNNLSLQVNQVGFYQLTKICIAPVVLVMEVCLLGKRTTRKVVASVGVVCAGVAAATLADKSIISSVLGLSVGLAAVLVTATYQIWAGSYQRSLQASSMQLLDQYCPIATGLLAATTLAAIPTPDTILGYTYTPTAIFFIALSCVLGLLVNLTTFLVIGATSSLTYNIVGHIKTVLILGGGCLFFGDVITLPKFCGIALAFSGIVWYSHLQMQESAAKAAPAAAPPANKPAKI